MLNLQRKFVDMNADAREYPRIEFHFPVAILGIDAEAKIIDFSLNGFYIETDSVTRITPCKKINLALRLPGERERDIDKG